MNPQPTAYKAVALPNELNRLKTLVGMEGLEPTRYFYHQNLNLACLPIPPLAQWAAILAGYRLITSPASRLTALQNTVKRLQILIDFADPVLQRTQPGIILL